MAKTIYFQDFMPENVCFGCGTNHDGLQIKSFWEEDESVCIWQSKPQFQGWKGLLNGGILATLIDCHCMGTAIAHAYKLENRKMDSEPVYRYATGTLTVRYLQPTPNEVIEIRAKVIEVKNRKTTLKCEVFAKGIKTAQADVIAIRVYDSSQNVENNVFKG